MRFATPPRGRLQVSSSLDTLLLYVTSRRRNISSYEAMAMCFDLIPALMAS